MERNLFEKWQMKYIDDFPAAIKEVEARIKSSKSDNELLYLKGVLELGSGMYTKALATLQKYRRANPSDPRAWYQLARCHHALLNNHEAFELYKQYSSSFPTKVEPFLAMIDLLEDAKDRQQALNISRQVAWNFPDSVLAQLNLAALCQKSSLDEEALDLYQRIVAKWPGEVSPHIQLAKIYLTQKKTPEALELIRKFLDRNPNSTDASVELAFVYLAMERDEDALKAYVNSPGMKDSENVNAEPLFIIGSRATRRKNYPLAIQAYEMILQIEPDDYPRYKLGQLMVLTGGRREAEDLATTIKKTSPDLANKLREEISHPEAIAKAMANTCPQPGSPGDEASRKPIILYKEKAKLTSSAISQRITGKILVSALFTSDGRVANLRVVRGLPEGLNEEAIKAAKKTRFVPACRGGQAVSVRMSIEFSFNLA